MDFLNQVLDDRDEYQLFATEEEAQIHSRVLTGFWLRPEWLWQADSLDPLLIFCEIADWPETLVNQIRAQIEAGSGRSESTSQEAINDND